MRAFVAIELSDEIKDTLDRIQSHLKYAGADVKWVAKDNIHLTLKFLGEISEEKCGKVKAALDNIAKEAGAFEITLKDIGAFPNTDYPRVIWIGLDKGAKESVELAGRIDEELSKMGFQKETRPFAAHLTISRVRSAKNREALKEKVLSCQLSTVGRQQILSVTLFQSTLTPKGPIYTKLHEAKLSVN